MKFDPKNKQTTSFKYLKILLHYFHPSFHFWISSSHFQIITFSIHSDSFCLVTMKSKCVVHTHTHTHTYIHRNPSTHTFYCRQCLSGTMKVSNKFRCDNSLIINHLASRRLYTYRHLKDIPTAYI
jgi:hypothetical protein